MSGEQKRDRVVSVYLPRWPFTLSDEIRAGVCVCECPNYSVRRLFQTLADAWEYAEAEAADIRCPLNGKPQPTISIGYVDGENFSDPPPESKAPASTAIETSAQLSKVAENQAHPTNEGRAAQ